MRWVCWLAVCFGCGALTPKRGRVGHRSSAGAKVAPPLRQVESLVEKRRALRGARQYAQADAVLKRIEAAGYRVVDKTDGSSELRAPVAPAPRSSWVLVLAKEARRVCVRTASEAEAAMEVEQLANEALRLLLAPSFEARRDLPGRQAADAAFSFAMSAATCEQLFDELARVAAVEMERTASMSATSGRALATRHAAEKLAASGCREVSQHAVFAQHAAPFLAERCRLWRWRYSSSKDAREDSRASPPAPPSDDAACDDANRAAVFPKFADPSLPLVVDLGSGLGSAALALGGEYGGRRNVLGIDAARACTRPATAFAQRLGITDHVAFARCDADDALRWARETYPGPVAAVLVQFPTPFKLQPDDALLEQEEQAAVETALEDDWLDAQFQGSQSAPPPPPPPSARKAVRSGELFLLTPQLARLAEDCLSRFQGDAFADAGELYLASNVEDVAIFAHDLVLDSTERFLAASADDGDVGHDDDGLADGHGDGGTGDARVKDHAPAAADAAQARRVPRRTKKWASDPANPRASGGPWRATSPFPAALTETDAMCATQGIPVHRVLFRIAAPGL